MSHKKECRFCCSELTHTFLDLNTSPLANSYLSENDLDKAESFYPLHTYVCKKCFLVQLQQYESPSHIFQDYAYFSSFSDSWLAHAQRYVEMAIQRFQLSSESQVIEIASNDGYLLQYFQREDVPVLGIEPAQNVADKAIENGIATRVDFFSQNIAQELAVQGYQADVIVANNVLAHVPNLMGFISGLKILLKPEGTITIEFPHLLQLITHNQFDTIYHEHFSYFSLFALATIFSSRGLHIYDVEELPTHGGSLRVYVKHEGDHTKDTSTYVSTLMNREKEFGLDNIETYDQFSRKVESLKCDLLDFFITAKREGKTIAGYGAPAKGNTLLNYCGIGREFLSYTVDRNHHKQGLYLPGSRIPIKALEEISITKPDYVFILPWNLKEEIMEQMHFIREWGGKFFVASPHVEVI